MISLTKRLQNTNFHTEAVAEVLMDYYKDWYREVMDKVIRFDMH